MAAPMGEASAAAEAFSDVLGGGQWTPQCACTLHDLGDQRGVVRGGTAILQEQIVFEAHPDMASQAGCGNGAGVFLWAESTHCPGVAAVMLLQEGK